MPNIITITNTKPPECADIIRRTLRGFTAGALEAHESVGRVLLSDVRGIMSTHEGSFVFIIHTSEIYFNQNIIAYGQAKYTLIKIL